MGSKQTSKTEMLTGNHDSCSNMRKTQRIRQYSTQSQETETSWRSQETATTGLSSETDSNMSMNKRSYGRSVSFCLSNENEDPDDLCSDSETRSTCNDVNNYTNLRSQPCTELAYNTISMETSQDATTKPVFSLQLNNPRGCCHHSFSEESLKQPLLRRQLTLSRGTINENHIDSEHEMRVPLLCNFDHNQCKKLCSSVKVLKRTLFVLCVFNIIFLVALIIVPTYVVLYMQTSKGPPPDIGQLQSTGEQQRQSSNCFECESLIKNIPTFRKTQTVIQSFGDNGRCCISDPEKLMTVLNQISEEAIEKAKGSVCNSCPFGSSENTIKPAVHLKSRGNGLINASEVFNRKNIESTHMVGWQSSGARDHQGLWGLLDQNGASIQVKSPGMYFVYVMIRHKGCIPNNFGCDNMQTTHPGIPLAPLKVALYICPRRMNVEQTSCSISAINQKHYPSKNGTQQNIYFGRLLYIAENENLYLGISGETFLHQESESHYLGFYKV